ncbi:MAG TPA: apolipoprotein N-acyltransferase [Aestuariivirgaceae bacterium]|jgi:apolipoprotein N-acyltransferase
MPLQVIRNFAHRFIILWGWRRIGAAFFFGAAAATAMQPLLFWPVLFVSFPVLIWLIDGLFVERANRLRRALGAFATGWTFGFGFFLASLYWVGAAFLVDAETYAWMMPLAVAALPAGMALYWGAAAALVTLWWAPGLRRILVFAAALAFSEWLRGRFFTGFPWNTLGYAAEASEGLSQVAAYVGIWGLTFLVVLWASLPALLSESESNSGSRRAVFFFMLAGIGLWLAGTMRLEKAPVAFVPGVNIRIVQPNVPQSDKWRADNVVKIFDDLLALTTAPSAGKSEAANMQKIVIWPESSVPFLMDEQPEALKTVARALPDDGVLLMGSLRRIRSQDPLPETEEVYNSLFAIDGMGKISATYDKWHLVPYGEYLPVASWLEPLGLRRLVTIPGNFSSGEGVRTISLPGTPSFSPLICYEAIFPGRVADTHNRPEWLLNITNDGWFGLTGGPHQHFAQARFRAIEEGLPLIRAANTGISAIIDAHGRVIDQLPLASRGTIDGSLPVSIPPTPYARYGDLLFFLGLTLSAATILIPRRAPKPSTAR